VTYLKTSKRIFGYMVILFVFVLGIPSFISYSQIFDRKSPEIHKFTPVDLVLLDFWIDEDYFVIRIGDYKHTWQGEEISIAISGNALIRGTADMKIPLNVRKGRGIGTNIRLLPSSDFNLSETSPSSCTVIISPPKNYFERNPSNNQKMKLLKYRLDFQAFIHKVEVFKMHTPPPGAREFPKRKIIITTKFRFIGRHTPVRSIRYHYTIKSLRDGSIFFQDRGYVDEVRSGEWTFKSIEKIRWYRRDTGQLVFELTIFPNRFDDPDSRNNQIYKRFKIFD
jgi:hypothetical protein